MAPTTPSAIDTEAVQENRPIVISGPSGAGKSTILKKLLKEYPDTFVFSISHTTRQPRGSEKHGVEYYFVQEDEFLDLVEKKAFIEHAKFGSNHYGTSVKAVNEMAEKGKICILDIEMEGVKQVANHSEFPRPLFIGILPPSLKVLEQRLRGRATDKEEDIQRRLKQAEKEIEFAKSNDAPHDVKIENDDLEETYKKVKDFLIKEGVVKGK